MEKGKKERDWKFIIGIVIFIVVFGGVAGAFWGTVADQARLVKQQEEEEERLSKRAMFLLYGENREQEVFVDMTSGELFTAKIPAEGIYNKKGTLIKEDVLEDGDIVIIYGDAKLTEGTPAVYAGVTRMQRDGRATLEEAEGYRKQIAEKL